MLPNDEFESTSEIPQPLNKNEETPRASEQVLDTSNPSNVSVVTASQVEQIQQNVLDRIDALSKQHSNKERVSVFQEIVLRVKDLLTLVEQAKQQLDVDEPIPENRQAAIAALDNVPRQMMQKLRDLGHQLTSNVESSDTADNCEKLSKLVERLVFSIFESQAVERPAPAVFESRTKTVPQKSPIPQSPSRLLQSNNAPPFRSVLIEFQEHIQSIYDSELPLDEILTDLSQRVVELIALHDAQTHHDSLKATLRRTQEALHQCARERDQLKNQLLEYREITRRQSMRHSPMHSRQTSHIAAVPHVIYETNDHEKNEEAMIPNAEEGPLSCLLQVVDDTERALKIVETATSAQTLNMRLIHRHAHRDPSRLERIAQLEWKVMRKKRTVNHYLTPNSAATLIQAYQKGFVARKWFKKQMMRKMSVMELVETETSYVKGLLNVFKLYLIPIRQRQYINTPVIPEMKVDIIFRMVQEILLLNKDLLIQLAQRYQKWHRDQVVGDIFTHQTVILRLYSAYILNYDAALATYHEARLTPSFRSFLNTVMAKQDRLALELPDLLITPVQRIPRYLLLLKEVQKRTNEQHPDYKLLSHAISRLGRTMDVINDNKRTAENHAQVEDIQSRIIGLPQPIVTEDRILVYDGELLEQSVTEISKKKGRHAFLFTDLLVVCSASPRGVFSNDRTTFEFKWSVPLIEAQVGPVGKIQSQSSPTSVQDSASNETLSAFGLVWNGENGIERRVMFAKDEEIRKKWLDFFEQAKKKRLEISKRNSSNVQMMRHESRGLGRSGSSASLASLDMNMNSRSLSRAESMERGNRFIKKDMMDANRAIEICKERIESAQSHIRQDQEKLNELERALQIETRPKQKQKLQQQKTECEQFLTKHQQELDWEHGILSQLEEILPPPSPPGDQKDAMRMSRRTMLIDWEDVQRQRHPIEPMDPNVQHQRANFRVRVIDRTTGREIHSGAGSTVRSPRLNLNRHASVLGKDTASPVLDQENFETNQKQAFMPRKGNNQYQS